MPYTPAIFLKNILHICSEARIGAVLYKGIVKKSGTVKASSMQVKLEWRKADLDRWNLSGREQVCPAPGSSFFLSLLKVSG